MKILALDTSTDACSAALWLNGAVRERFELGNKHSQRILSMVHELLAEANLALTQLDAVAFGRGPGSFTGLRIGAGVAQGLAFGATLPVVPVSSLAALAQGQDAPKLLAGFDARMQQVYWGAYVRVADGSVKLLGREQVVAPSGVPLPDDAGWVGVGSGWDRYADTLTQRLGGRVSAWRAQCFPHAADVARLGAIELKAGRTVPAEAALPVYIRDEVATPTGR